jgi:DNA-binding CsgD family transcriptional regulator
LICLNGSDYHVACDEKETITQSDYACCADYFSERPDEGSAKVSQEAHLRSTMRAVATKFEGLKSLPASVVILDASGTIVAVNDTWKRFGRRNGLRIPHSCIGSNYLQYCRSDDPHSRRFVRRLRALLAGRLDLLTLIYPCHSPTRARWFSLIGMPLSLDKPTGVALLHVNLSDMLPPPISTQRRRADKKQRGHIRPAANLNAISDAVERSVSEALALQLATMLAGPRQGSAGEKDAAQEQSDQMTSVRTRLSKRQIDVLRLLGEGKTNKEMAKVLFLSPNTIKLHVSAILQRLKLRSRTHAALLSSSLNKQDWVDLSRGDLTAWKKMRTAA